MSDGGPSAAELGITQQDLGLEAKKDSPKVVLPDPPEEELKVWGKEQIVDGVKTRSSDYADYTFQREQELPPQEQFSDSVKNMILAPIRGELDNGNFANFLRQLNEQKGFDGQDKLGLVLLINDNAKDQDEGKRVVDENHLVARYISLLEAKDIDGVGQLDIPQEYKELAKEIVDRDMLEIRQDYLHADQSSVHFGLLRQHLFREAKAFKNSSLADDDAIVHLSDIDTIYSSRHFETLKNFYADPSHEANLSEQDFLPGVHEGEKTEDISRDLLSHLDEFRLYRYGADTQELLGGSAASGTPIISGRLLSNINVEFKYGQLREYQENEDYFIGRQMRKLGGEFGKKVGNVGEVYRGHRARSVDRTGSGEMEVDGVKHESTDADEAFSITKKIQKGGLSSGKYDLLTQGDEYIDSLEEHASKAKNKENPQDAHSEKFKEGEEYKEILKTELRKEQAKVRLRRMRLMGYVDSLKEGGELKEGDQKIVDPYLEYFQDETDEMKRQIAEGKTPEQVSVGYIHKYDAFFNPDTPIHMQIARIRALKKYTFAHNLSV